MVAECLLSICFALFCVLLVEECLFPICFDIDVSILYAFILDNVCVFVCFSFILLSSLFCDILFRHCLNIRRCRLISFGFYRLILLM